MGLDSFLRSTGKRHRKQMALAKKLGAEFDDWVIKLYNSDKYAEFNTFPQDTDGSHRVTLDLCTEEQKARFKSLLEKFKGECREKAKALGGTLDEYVFRFVLTIPEEERDPVDEIGYWRKDWNLHNFIVKLCGDEKDDNLVEIYLDEAAITKVLEQFPYQEFKTALDIVRGGGEVFYYAWY